MLITGQMDWRKGADGTWGAGGGGDGGLCVCDTSPRYPGLAAELVGTRRQEGAPGFVTQANM